MTHSQDTTPMFDDTQPAVSSTGYGNHVYKGIEIGDHKSTEFTAMAVSTPTQEQGIYGQTRGHIGTPITTSVLEENASEKILKEGKLDWTVYTRDGLDDPTFTYANKLVPRHVYRFNPEKMVDKDGQPTTRAENACHKLSPKKLLTIAVSKDWKPVQNSMLINNVVNFCVEAGTEIERVGTLKDDTTVFSVLSLADNFALQGDDINEARMIVTNRHCPGGFTFSMLAMRKICTNGLTVPVRVKGMKLSHVSQISNEHIQKIMAQVHAAFLGYKEGAELTSQVPSTLSALGRMSDYAGKLFKVRTFALEKFGIKDDFGAPKPLADQPLWLREMITHDEHLLASIVAISAVKKTSAAQFTDETEFETLPQAYRDIMGIYQKETLASSFNTVWGGVNGVTGFIDHFSKTRNGLEGHYQSTWFGSKANAKQEAFRTAQAVSALVLS